MEVSRGDLVTIALPGDHGKPCPALVVQADAFRTLASVTVLSLTSDLHDWPLFRITIRPNRANGLRRHRIGHADRATMRLVDTALAGLVGLR